MSKRLDFYTLKTNYDTVVFDMDGVMTSEQTYWDCAALTAYEYLNSKDYFGSFRLKADEVIYNAESIRKNLLCNDRIITLCKNTGVNSNWDLAYITIGLWLEFANGEQCVQYLENCHDLSNLYEFTAQVISEKSLRSIDECRRNKSFWNEVVSCFQEWYLGYDEYVRLYSKQPVLKGKPFLCEAEKPLLDLAELSNLLKLLINSGITLGVATGRNTFEISVPLKKWGIYDFFDQSRIITYDYVQNAENVLLQKGIEYSLAKPAPYCFVKSALGNSFSDEDIVSGNYNVNSRVLVVGDAGADIFAAQHAGFDFLAVLTGVNGESARGFFEKNKATYINNSLLDICK